MKDPLAGKRQAINEGTAYSLMWLDTGAGCPVEIDDVFKLRSCRIQITKTHRVQKDRKWWWRAEFHRYVPERIYLLKRSGGGYTEDEDQARRAQDDVDNAETLQSVHPQENPLNLRTPPEPEAVPPHEIADLQGSREARQRYLREVAEERLAEATAPLEERLARVREAAGSKHVDISGELRIAEKQIAKAERKLERAA